MTTLADAHVSEPTKPIKLSRAINLSALWMVVRITAARQGRGRRLVIMTVMFSLPIVLAILVRPYQVPYRPESTANVVIFGVFFQALVPLAALLFASGMVLDDVEEQTITYLLIRPISRTAIYLSKLLGTFLITWVRASVFAIATLITIYWGEPDLWSSILPNHGPGVVVLLALALGAYVSIFGGLSLVIRRTLVVGAIYIAVFEGFLANVDFVFRYATVMYYIRVLSIRWFDLTGADWSIDPSAAPSSVTSLAVLLGTTLSFSLAGALIFNAREFRVKTPEGG